MAKSKKSKAKKPSKRELKIHYKIVYQNRKLKKLRDQYDELNSLDKRTKIEYNGKKRKVKAALNDIINKAAKINGEIYALRSKSKRSRPAQQIKVKRNEYVMIINSRVWETTDIENAILKNPEISRVNGIDLTRDKDEAIDLINKYRLKMTSSDLLMLVYDDKMNAKLRVINRDLAQQIDDETEDEF